MSNEAAPKQSWILQLAALAMWTIVTCYAAYKVGFDNGAQSRGNIEHGVSYPIGSR
jgi:hypothetical protein